MKGSFLLKRTLSRTADYLRNNHLALVALFIALGGTGYAAAGLRSQSASTRTPALTAHGQVVAWAIVNFKGHVVAGGPQPRVRVGGSGSSYTVFWRGVPTSRKRKMYCASPVTVDQQFSPFDESAPSPLTAGYAVVNNAGHVVYVSTFNPSGQPTALGFEVALICPTTS
jgi:hypothetical protein